MAAPAVAAHAAAAHAAAAAAVATRRSSRPRHHGRTRRLHNGRSRLPRHGRSHLPHNGPKRDFDPVLQIFRLCGNHEQARAFAHLAFSKPHAIGQAQRSSARSKPQETAFAPCHKVEKFAEARSKPARARADFFLGGGRGASPTAPLPHRRAAHPAAAPCATGSASSSKRPRSQEGASRSAWPPREPLHRTASRRRTGRT